MTRAEAFSYLCQNSKREKFNPDWRNLKEKKWYVYYDYDNGCLDVECVYGWTPTPIVYKTKTQALNRLLINSKTEKAYLIYLGVMPENE